MVFTGTYEHTIDAKNRLAIAADLRRQLSANAGATGAASDEPVRVYVTLGEQQALCIYTEARFEQRAEELDRSDWDTDRILEYERIMFTLSALVEVDKQGRIRLPEHLLRRAGLSGDVVLLGVKDHIEIRDRDAWMAYLESVLKDQPSLLMNPRRAMKRPTEQQGPHQGPGTDRAT